MSRVPRLLPSLAAPLAVALALPVLADVDAQFMARAFPRGGSKASDTSNVQVAQARELAAKALGDDVRDLVFVPVTPCTVWDTRFATEPQSGGAIGNGQTKRFFSHDGSAGSFTTWGGNPTCTEATQAFIGGRPFAALMTVYINDATSNGWLTLYRDGDADPSNATISVYYSPGPTRTQTVISKSSRGYGSGSFDIAATSRFGSVNAAASVTGYFIKAVNITLPNSTATTGNILKAGTRFIHNFGTQNTFVGVEAGNFSMTGEANVALGYQALQSNLGSHGNTAAGAFALTSNEGGEYNAALGYRALESNTTGTTNVAVGAFALFVKETGGVNVAVGSSALPQLVNGSGNIALGTSAGENLTAGSGNIFIGAPASSGTESSTTRIGVAQTRAFMAGIRGITTTNSNAIPVLVDSAGQLGTVNSSRRAKEDVADMADASAALMRLRPVTFHYRLDGDPKDRRLQYGLIAEEVAELYPGLIARLANGDAETVLYQFLPPMLLNEVQKQQRTIEELRAELAELRREMHLIRKGNQ